MVKIGFFHEFGALLRRNKTFINYIFLGVGLALFVMNIAAYMSFVHTMDYSKFLFNTSVFSAMIIILFAVYSVSTNK